jgi:cyclic pyranopterin phosphate synthase
MVDVSEKAVTVRTALAMASVWMRPETFRRVAERSIAKGDVLQVARLAGIMAAKKTPDLIPLCHPLPIDAVNVDFDLVEEDHRVDVRATVRVAARTGVEMEALTAASVAALTIYDMIVPGHMGEVSALIGTAMTLFKQGGKPGA